MEKKRISIDLPSVWLALTTVFLTVLTPLLSSIAMTAVKGPLPAALPAVLDGISVLLAGVTLLLYFCYRRKTTGQGGRRIRRALPVMKAELWLLAAFLLWRTPWYILADMAPVSLIDNAGLIQVLVWIWIAAGLLAADILLHWLIHIAWQSNQKIGFGASLAHLLRHPLILLLSLLCTALLPAVSVLTGTLGTLLGLGGSFLSMIGAHLLDAAGYYLVLLALFYVLRRAELKDLQKAPAEPEPDGAELPAEGSRRRGLTGSLISCGVAAVLVIAASLYQGADALFVSAQERIFSSVENSLDQAEEKVLEGSFDAALLEVRTVSAQLQALDTYVNEDARGDIRSLREENPQDPLIGMLYLLQTGRAEEVEQKVRTGVLDAAYYPALLRYYQTLEMLTPEQTDLQTQMLQICIANEKFTSNLPKVSDLDGEKLAVQKKLEVYQEYVQMYDGLELATAYGKGGGVTQELVDQALDLAEENLENAALQYIAVAIGSSYQADGAHHYERTMEAAERLDALYMESAEDDEAIAREKAALGQAAMNCYEYETAKAYLDQAYARKPEAAYALMSAQCSERLGDYETCYALASEAANQDETSDQALYLACVSALKMKHTDDALEAAGKLSDLVESRQAQDMLLAEQRLYVCAQYMAMRDDSYWTDYTCYVYEELTDAQRREAARHPLLQNYMEALYQCHMKHNYEAAEEAVDSILSTREDLHYAWYLKGTILSNEKEFKAALAAYKKAEAINSSVPATLFSIANTCDALGDYETAYQYCQRIAQLMPDVDHGSDMYGIIYHNQRLMTALEKELKQ